LPRSFLSSTVEGMGSHEVDENPLFVLRADLPIACGPRALYDIVSDLPRSGGWSPECRGGEWVSGRPGEVGSVFRGLNHRAADVVAWAPVVRGDWHTRAEVITAEPGLSFRWSMLDSSGRGQDSVWAFDIAEAEGGSVLAHSFRMGAPTEGIRGITAGMDTAAEQRFFAEWAEKVRGDLAATVARIKEIAERP